MIAGEIISEDIYPVKPSDKLRLALDRMQENHIGQLPVVKNNQFLGLLNEDDVVAIKPEKELVKSIEYGHELLFAYENQHIYDVIRLFYVHQLDVLPVLTEKYCYVGTITLRGLVNQMTLLTGSGETGGIIVLEINNRDNALSHIAQIVESDNAQIMSSYVRSFPDSTRMEITLKLNRTDISSIIASFLRYDYIVKATFNDAKVYDSSQDRYDQLMNYLNM
jgi:predicted transcriptional regulator